MEQEILETIQRATKRMSSKYKFKNYDTEDIEQEAFMICMKALDKYNGSIPLEHFLLHHLSNRLKNLKRDKANFRHTKILYPVPIHTVPQNDDSFLLEEQIEDILDCEAIKQQIDQNLPAEYREDYLMLINGAEIPYSRKIKIRDMIYNILYPSSYLDNVVEND
jgi:DNA-directed RNA polymerase specialized sigma24 family protein